MNTVEIFAGTESFSKVARMRGHKTYTIDNNPIFKSDFVCDVLDPGSQLKIWEKIRNADVVWMSPVCTTFSMAGCNTHYRKDRSPKTVNAIIGKQLLDFCKTVAQYCEENNKIYFIENPMARMRWFMSKDTLHHIWYCKYGDKRAKPTDIWTNLRGWKGKKCHNGNKDCHHESAPRGSKTGTQGLKGNMERSVIPSKLFEELFDILELKK